MNFYYYFYYYNEGEFFKELSKFSKIDRAKIVSRINRIEKYGLMIAAQKLWVKKIDDNLFEIRIHFDHGISRSIYFEDIDANYVITQNFVKRA
ncbi:type II toxin-antitoxin system RelE/ParE family toxin [Lentilactobacillus kisonensis]|uniref:type II toxin-antitoxin system RelE/ParE family toxin n=1 Tax=Lentilactobacillus kisonensis TaxID=481722 RepID=UPI0006D17AB7|nr:type II toxin-antitoxin system RelE/ParE family toxin [Lentilactobacillus kisonensis]